MRGIGICKHLNAHGLVNKDILYMGTCSHLELYMIIFPFPRHHIWAHVEIQVHTTPHDMGGL